MLSFKVIIVISTSFLGAFWSVNGIDYYLENSKALYYSVNILHGNWEYKIKKEIRGRCNMKSLEAPI